MYIFDWVGEIVLFRRVMGGVHHPRNPEAVVVRFENSNCLFSNYRYLCGFKTLSSEFYARLAIFLKDVQELVGNTVSCIRG
jgi:hypothetical protein